MGILERGLAILRMREVAETISSVNKLEKWVRAEGLGYQNTLLHRDASNAWYAARAPKIQGALNLDSPLMGGQYLKGYWNRAERYKMIGEAIWYDPVNDREYIRMFSLYADDDEPTDDLLENWRPEHDEYLTGQQQWLVEVKVVEKWKKIGST